jgi:hypothetical protein
MEKQKLPNVNAVLILGIFSILTCCCWGVIGITLGFIALALAKKDINLYKANPELYNGYSNLNTGKILAIIGIILSSICLLVNIFFYIIIGSEGIQQMQKEMIEKMQNR